MDLSNWFKGFELGIARLTEEERKRFFAECGKNCVRNGVLPIYEKLYKDANGNMDTFFRKANELPGVSGEVVKEGQIYRFSFLECTCGLHTEGHVRTPLLCECSRQSVLYALHSLWQEHDFRVTLCCSILQGNEKCIMQIEVIQGRSQSS